MNKLYITSTRLVCKLQHDTEITNNKCFTGILSKNTKGYKFEEAVRKGRPPRNPKLFDGNYISMVKMQNGRYHFHLKTFDISIIDRPKVAMSIYDEIVTALQIAD